MSFREKVIQEAKKQAVLRAKHQPIPQSLRKYARWSGFFVWIVGGVGCAIILWISLISQTYYIFAILFPGTLSVMGFIQMLTGKQILNRGK